MKSTAALNVPKLIVDKIKQKHIMEIFRDLVDQFGDVIAVEFKDEYLTYRELDEKSNQIGNFLLKKNVKVGDMVAICMKRSIETVIWMLGIFKVSAIYIPLSMKFPKNRIDETLLEAGCKNVVLSSSANSLFENFDGGQLFVSDEIHSTIFQTESKECPIPSHLSSRLSSETTIALFFTSGSTGVPKAVMVSSQNIAAHSLCRFRYFKLNNEDKYAAFASITVMFSLCEFLIPLLNGITLVIVPEEIRSDTGSLMQYINEHKVTAFVLTSVLLKHLPKKDFDHQLKVVGVGGEACDYKTMKFWSNKVPLFNTYGMTESTAAVVMKRWDHQNDNLCVGKPFGTNTIYILDDNMKPIIEPNIPGEVYIEGLEVTQGYFGSKTKKLEMEKYLSNPFYNPKISISSPKMLRTGDFCKWNVDGEIVFVGRQDHQKKIRGHRINFIEIEKVFRDGLSKVVKDVVVGMKTNQLGNSKLVAYILRFPEEQEINNNKNNKKLIMEYMKKKLPDYMVPTNYVFLDHFPKTVSDKIDRQKIVNEIPVEGLNNDDDPNKIMNRSRKYIKYIHHLLSDDKEEEEEDQLNRPFQDSGSDSISTLMIKKELERKSLHLTFSELMNTPIRKILELLESDDDQNYCNKNDNITSNESSKTRKRVILDISKELKKCEAFKKRLLIREEEEEKEEDFNNWVENPSGILITGAGGFLGSYILQDLIKKYTYPIKKTKVYMLLRRDNMKMIESSEEEHIKIIVGDLSKENLGLEQEQYDELVEKIDMVIHCAAQVNHFSDVESHYAANVSSFYPLMKICKGVKPFVYISTLSVFNKTIKSSELVNDVHFQDQGYFGSKWITDCCISQYFGDSSIIIRPPFIMGDIHSGRCNPKDWVSRLFCMFKDMKSVPVRGGKMLDDIGFNSLSVNFVAQTTVDLLSDPKRYGQSYNLCFENISFVRISELLVSKFGYKALRFEEWISKAEEILLKDETHPFFHFVEKFQKRGRILGDDEFTKIECGNFDDLKTGWKECTEHDLEKYFEFLQRNG